jgi:uncharacterized repeat protein (TIGR01451 family)
MMKKFDIRRVVLPVIAVLSVGIFVPVYSALAWGPERPNYYWDKPAAERTFNSMVDNPTLGDERYFVRIREANVGTYVADSINLEVGKEYEVYIYFHNNAAANLNESGKGIANNVRMSTSMPASLEKGETGTISATISAANANPEAVWDEVDVVAPGKVYLRYVPDTAIIHSKGSIDGKNVGPDYLFSDEGALIGYDDKYWGIVPGCNDYAGYVTYRFRVDQPRFEISKQVSRDGKNEWVERITAVPNEVLDFRILYKNTGTTEQKDVAVYDALDYRLVYLGGTTSLIVNGASQGTVADDLFGVGLNIGKYQPGSQAELQYKVRVAGEDELDCGDNVLTNAASVSTANGTMEDHVEVTVKKDCTPGELPVTGPGEIVLAVVAVGAMRVGGTYWWRSRRALKKVSDSID